MHSIAFALVSKKRKPTHMLSELFWITFGGLVGWIAAILQNEYSPKRVAWFIAAGMAGGFLGGFGGGLLGTETIEYDATATGMMFAIFGAVVVVAVASNVDNRRSE
jgi:uncharacterized membrane protein YeaQ/YmgE (transglycosylase-associated protein family)